MRYPASEKLEIIRIVEQSHLPIKQTLDKLGIPRTTFYRWYDRYQIGGPGALEDQSSQPSRVWNRIPDDVRERIVDLALDVPELSPRELATKMRQKSQTRQTGAAKAIKDIRRATRKQYSAEEKIRIVLDGLRGEETIAELCRREGIAQSIYYKWSKEFLEAGKRRLAGDTARAASTGEVTALRREARELKEVVAEQTLELRLLKKSMIADGGDDE